jgi:DNA-binding PadR family transcriptional regulator
MQEPGSLESAILLAVLRESDSAYAPEVRQSASNAVGRAISRGAFYTTMERLAQKGWVAWESEVPRDSRRDLAQRRYRVTRSGLAILRQRKAQLAAEWQRLAEAVGD